MSPETTSTKLCPTCGTRLAENATRCVVCGSEFSATPKPKAKSEKAVQGARMPEVTLSLPVALAILAGFLVIGAAALYFTLQGTHQIQAPTAIPSPTITSTLTSTPTDTLIPTDTPTLTPQPPVNYTVQAGDSCGAIASLYNSSVAAIISLNNLNSTCTNLAIGQKIKVPLPTPTPASPSHRNPGTSCSNPGRLRNRGIYRSGKRHSQHHRDQLRRLDASHQRSKRPEHR